MARVTPSPPLEASVHVDAPPAAVWAAVGDPRRTGEWSPECRRVVVLGRGPLRAGRVLVGVNRRRAVVWATTSRVDTYDPGREIAWTVRESATRWSYLLEPDATGTRLVQRGRRREPAPSRRGSPGPSSAAAPSTTSSCSPA